MRPESKSNFSKKVEEEVIEEPSEINKEPAFEIVEEPIVETIKEIEDTSEETGEIEDTSEEKTDE